MARPSFELAFDEEIIETPPKKIFRFASVDEASMDKLDMKRVPDATRKTTEKWLRIAKQYFEEKQIECDFRTVAKEDLSRLLRQMYVELRQKNGEVYSKSSLLGFRASIQRHYSGFYSWPSWNFVKEWRGVQGVLCTANWRYTTPLGVL